MSVFEDHSYLMESQFDEEIKTEDLPEIPEISELARSRELISYVRRNPVLYNKSHKNFMNTTIKTLTWTTIGAKLTSPMTGTEAAAAFYKLRQKFGKERNKVRKTQPRSGAGSDAPGYTHMSDGPMYRDLMCLADLMRARDRTSSNYKARQVVSLSQPIKREVSSLPSGNCKIIVKRQNLPSPIHASTFSEGLGQITLNCSSPAPSTSSTLISTSSTHHSPSGLHISSTLRSSMPINQSLPGPSTSSKSWNPELFKSFAGSPADDSSSEASGLEDIDCVEVEDPEIQEDQRSPALKPVHPRQKVPEPNSFHKRRTSQTHAINESILMSNKNISRLAALVEAALDKAKGNETTPQGTAEGTSALSPTVQSMLSSLGWALTRVQEEDQLNCLIDLLTMVDSKYCQK